jgi:hypothetical protein
MAEIVTGSSIPEKRTIRIASFGDVRTGKTHFSFTAPKKIGLVPLDQNSIPTYKRLERELDMEGSVYYPKRPLISEEDIRAMLRPIRMAMSTRQESQGKRTDAGVALEKEVLRFYRSKIDEITDLCFTYYSKPDVNTVVIDTGSQLYDFMMFAHFGRHSNVDPLSRGPLNQEMRDLMYACPKHLIVIHPVKEEWANGKPTGRRVMDGWSKLNYCMSVCGENIKVGSIYDKRRVIETLRGAGVDEDAVEEYEEEMDVDNLPVFGMHVFDSQANPMLTRERTLLLGPRCTFAHLAMAVFPDSDVEDWESE